MKIGKRRKGKEREGGALKPLVNCFLELLKSKETVMIEEKAFFKDIEFDKRNRVFFRILGRFCK